MYLDGGFATARGMYVGGNVGIGVTSPAEKLQVDGKVRATGYCIGTDCITGWAAVGMPAGSSGQTLRHDGTSWVANSVLFNNGTNVGIGTTTPGAKLEVAGQIKITGGTPGAGKVLTSDAAGLASWETVAAAPYAAFTYISGTYRPCTCPSGWTAFSSPQTRMGGGVLCPEEVYGYSGYSFCRHCSCVRTTGAGWCYRSGIYATATCPSGWSVFQSAQRYGPNCPDEVNQYPGDHFCRDVCCYRN